MPGPLFVGIGGHVVAIDPATGTEIWRTRLKRSSCVTVQAHPDVVYAGAGGELVCLAPATGTMRWRNHMPGLGLGLVTFSSAAVAAAVHAADAAAPTG